MKKKLYTTGITFFVTQEMYHQVISATNEMEIGVSELMRDLLGDYLESVQIEKYLDGDNGIRGDSDEKSN
jgi:hypothetical protein